MKYLKINPKEIINSELYTEIYFERKDKKYHAVKIGNNEWSIKEIEDFPFTKLISIH
jgi:hypothetical protein